MPQLITNTNYISTSALYDTNYIAHHGIKGQKWGIRRFQNEDGSLKAAGLSRYRTKNKDGSLTEKGEKRLSRELKKLDRLQNKISDDFNERQHRKRVYQFQAGRSKNDTRRRTSNILLREVNNNRKNIVRAKRQYDRISKKYGSVGINRMTTAQISRGQRIMDQYKEEMRAYRIALITGMTAPVDASNKTYLKKH